ncbi:hypothetical protein B0H14DRAFT_3461186 [Mycena olivaceomarginata]|nr:hypothetical protein B0H14DRAFT_3461186 [Mycena olivaceomarginata]
MSRGAAGLVRVRRCVHGSLSPVACHPCMAAVVVGGMDWVLRGFLFIVSCHPSTAAVVVGGTDWVLRGMHKAKADACTPLHLTFLWSMECETGDPQSTDVGQIQSPPPAPVHVRPQAAVCASHPSQQSSPLWPFAPLLTMASPPPAPAGTYDWAPMATWTTHAGVMRRH